MSLIAVSGSQGTGKSTLINELAPCYKSITRKTSRSILSDWGVTLSEVNNNRPLTVRFQEEVLKRKLDDEKQAVDSKDTYITERTFADLFVYALVAIGKDNEHSDWLDEYYHRCAEAQKCYDHVFYLTAGHFQPVNDGVRAINRHYSWMVDAAMHRYTQLITDESKFYVIETPDLEKRADFVYNTVEDLHPLKIVMTQSIVI